MVTEISSLTKAQAASRGAAHHRARPLDSAMKVLEFREKSSGT